MAALERDLAAYAAVGVAGGGKGPGAAAEGDDADAGEEFDWSEYNGAEDWSSGSVSGSLSETLAGSLAGSVSPAEAEAGDQAEQLERMWAAENKRVAEEE